LGRESGVFGYLPQQRRAVSRAWDGVVLIYWTNDCVEHQRHFETQRDALRHLVNMTTKDELSGWQIEDYRGIVSSDMSPSELSRLVLGAL
jgi:hypothetical protein